jgi:hypothetical protein
MVGMTVWAGHYDVYVDLDVYDEVEEINEDNNTIFTVLLSLYAINLSRMLTGRNYPEEGRGTRSQCLRRTWNRRLATSKLEVSLLTQSLRDIFEPRFGYDFSRVRILSDALAAQMWEKFAGRKYGVEKPEGLHLLAHELTHVVQAHSFQRTEFPSAYK